MEAITLLEEWVQSVGSQAGLTGQNATILSGAVGVPESRLEASSPHVAKASSVLVAPAYAVWRAASCA